MRKGQTSAFIIAGILIVFLVAMMMVATKPRKITIQTTTQQVDTRGVHYFMSGCLKDLLEDLIIQAQANGGAITPKGKTLITPDGYYILLTDGETNHIQIRSQLEDEIKIGMELFGQTCIRQVENKIKGQKIHQVRPPSVDIKAGNDEVTMEYDAHGIIKTMEVQDLIPKIKVVIKTKTGTFIDQAGAIVMMIADNPGQVDMTDLSNMQTPIKLIPYNKNVVLIEMQDPDNNLQGKPSTFRFGVGWR